jgi:hypothetical protein
MPAEGECQTDHRHVQRINRSHATMGVDIGDNSFHVAGLDLGRWTRR